MLRRNLILFSVLGCLLATAPVSAQWTSEGVEYHENVIYQSYPGAIVPDGTGGMYVFFLDNLDAVADHDLLAVRLDDHGRTVWPDPVIVAGGTGDEWLRSACPDGAGGAYLAIDHNVDPPVGLTVQRLSADGSLAYAGSGVPVTMDNTVFLQVVSDGQGVTVIWEERDTDYDLWAQRLAADGTVQWAPGGVVVSNATDDQVYPEAVPLLDGSTVVIWEDSRDLGTTGLDIYAQRIASDGSMLWTSQGLPVCTANGIQTEARIDAHPSGGVVIGWLDQRSGSTDVYGQHLAADGSENWTSGGLAVAAGSQNCSWADVACFANGGTAFVWWDSRNSPDVNVAAQYVTPAGTAYYPGGWIISENAGSLGYVSAEQDGIGGVVIGWQDDSSGQSQMWGQRFEGITSTWNGGSPLLVSQGATSASLPKFAADGMGGLLAAYRRDPYENWAQRIGPLGDWGLPSGEIAAVEDVPDDEGGWVRLRCTPSRNDGGAGEIGILGYKVWRLAGDGAKAEAGVPTLSELLDGGFVGRRIGPGAAKALELPAGTWESIGYHPAVALAEYLLLAPTRTDSSDAGPAREVFCLTTHTDVDGIVYASLPDSGSSVDNLAPDPPKDLGGSADWDAGGVTLQWGDGGKATDDIVGYNVYRGGDADFPADATHQVGTTTETSYFDPISPGSVPYYKVTSEDRHGNESTATLLVPGDISGVDLPAAYHYRLDQNHPNPFNPRTTIVFEMERTGPVWLHVHDLSGRLVRTLLAGASVQKGVRKVIWQGDDDQGRRVAAGVYVYRLETPGFEAARRMVLVK